MEDQVYVTDLIEYDSFSGRRKNGHVVFLNKDHFADYQSSEMQSRAKNGSHTPDYYENFENGRYEKCTELVKTDLMVNLANGEKFVFVKSFDK